VQFAFFGLLYWQSIALASSQRHQRGQVANVGRNRPQLVRSQLPINQLSVNVYTWLCSIAEHALLLAHSSVSAINLPMSDGIDVSRLPYNALPIEQNQHAINLGFSPFVEHRTHSVVNAVNVPMSDGIDGDDNPKKPLFDRQLTNSYPKRQTTHSSVTPALVQFKRNPDGHGSFAANRTHCELEQPTFAVSMRDGCQ
jgi:hypothetical protein